MKKCLFYKTIKIRVFSIKIPEKRMPLIYGMYLPKFCRIEALNLKHFALIRQKQYFCPVRNSISLFRPGFLQSLSFSNHHVRRPSFLSWSSG